MKKTGFVTFLTAAVMMASLVTTADAAYDFSKLKNVLLMNAKSDSSLDTNGNGIVNVMDICREKSKLLYPDKWQDVPQEPENYSFLSLGKPAVDYVNGILTVPVNLSKTYIDLKKVNFKIKADVSAFQLENLVMGEIPGSLNIGYSAGSYECEWEFMSNAMSGGTLMNLQFNLNLKQSGTYSFSIHSVTASAEKDGKEYQLSYADCPEKSAPLVLTVNNGKITDIKVPEPPVYQGAEVPSVDDSEIYSAMIALKTEYPEGMKWTNANSYSWNGGIFGTGYGCAGFAFILSDAAFGKLPARMVEGAELASFEIRTGDILRLSGDSHSVIVLSKVQGGVEVAEGNYNSSVHWGRIIPDSELKKLTYILTRYPD